MVFVMVVVLDENRTERLIGCFVRMLNVFEYQVKRCFR